MGYKAVSTIYRENATSLIRNNVFEIWLKYAIERAVMSGRVQADFTESPTGKKKFEVTPDLEAFVKREIESYRGKGIPQVSDPERYGPLVSGYVRGLDAAELCGNRRLVSFNVAWKDFIEAYPEYKEYMKTKHDRNGTVHYRITRKTALEKFIQFLVESKEKGKEKFRNVTEFDSCQAERVVSKDF